MLNVFIKFLSLCKSKSTFLLRINFFYKISDHSNSTIYLCEEMNLRFLKFLKFASLLSITWHLIQQSLVGKRKFPFEVVSQNMLLTIVLIFTLSVTLS
jgi:hypothetical protein